MLGEEVLLVRMGDALGRDCEGDWGMRDVDERFGRVVDTAEEAGPVIFPSEWSSKYQISIWSKRNDDTDVSTLFKTRMNVWGLPGTNEELEKQLVVT